MAEVRTNLVIEAKSKGFDSVDKASKTLSSSFVKGAKAVDAMGAASAKTLGTFGKWKTSVASLDKALQFQKGHKSVQQMASGFDKLANLTGKQLPQHLAKLTSMMDALAKSVDAVAKATGRVRAPGGGNRRPGGGGDDPGRGSFGQGFLEGILPGSRVIDRGPGAVRQAMGIYAGDRLRQGAGGLASTPYTGEQGITQALGAVPVVGGGLSAIGGQALQNAHSAIAFHRQQLGMRYMLGDTGVRGDMQGAYAQEYARAGVGDAAVRARVERTRRQAAGAYSPTGPESLQIGKASRDLLDARVQARAQNLAFRDHVDLGGMFSDSDRQKYSIQAANQLGARGVRGLRGRAFIDDPNHVFMSQAEAPFRQRFADQAAGQVQSAAEAQRAQARARVRGRTLDPVQNAGMNLAGLDLGETQSYMGQVLQRGGGMGQGMLDQGLLTTGLSAQTMYGVDAGTTGAYLGAGRRGGIAGSQGKKGDDLLMKGLQDAVKMGLEGSEIAEYMQTMASGIESFKQTGIPLAQDSIGKLGMGISATTGIGGVRGSMAAQNFISSTQQIGRNGPQSAMDALTYQEYGYKGGDLDQAWETSKKMQNPDAKDVGKHMDNIFRTVNQAATLGGTDKRSLAAGRFTLQGAMDEKGIKLTPDELEAYQRHVMGTETDQDKERIASAQQAIQATMSPTKESLAKDASRRVGSINRTEAALRNRKEASGEGLVKTVQNMDDAVTHMTELFSSKLGPAVDGLSDVLNGGTRKIASIFGGGANGGGRPHGPPSHKARR